MWNGEYKVSESTAARRRVYLHLVDATDGITAETGEAAGQPQLSKNGAAWANTTATLTAIGNGRYYVELTAAELDTLGSIQIRYKSANTAEAFGGAKVVGYDPYATAYDAIAQAGATGSITLASTASTSDSLYNGQLVELVGGTGAGQCRLITAYVGSTRVATVEPNWIATPDNTSQYILRSWGYAPALAATAVTTVRDAVTNDVIETQGSYTLQQAISIILAATAGVTSGGGLVIKTPNGSATRVTAVVDTSNNRTGITLSPSA